MGYYYRRVGAEASVLAARLHYLCPSVSDGPFSSITDHTVRKRKSWYQCTFTVNALPLPNVSYSLPTPTGSAVPHAWVPPLNGVLSPLSHTIPSSSSSSSFPLLSPAHLALRYAQSTTAGKTGTERRRASSRPTRRVSRQGWPRSPSTSTGRASSSGPVSNSTRPRSPTNLM